MEYKSNRGPQKKCENAIYNLPGNNENSTMCADCIFKLYYLLHTHKHRHTDTATHKLVCFYYYYEIDSKLSVQMCGWPCECVCVCERPFVSMIIRRVIQLTFYSSTSTRLGPTLAMHLCLGFVFISLNWDSIKSGSCKSYDISHCRVQSNTKDYNYGYISVQMQSWEW